MKASTGLYLAAYFGLSSAAAIGDRNARAFGKRDDSCTCAPGQNQGTSISTITQWATSTAYQTITSYLPSIQIPAGSASTSAQATPVRAASTSPAVTSSSDVAAVTGAATSGQGTVYVTDMTFETVTTCPVGHTLTESGSTVVLSTPRVVTSRYSTRSTIPASSTPTAAQSTPASYTPESSSVVNAETASTPGVPSSIARAATSSAAGVRTETAWSTELSTVTSCGPDVTNCPASSTVVHTSLASSSVTFQTSVARTPSSSEADAASAPTSSKSVAVLTSSQAIVPVGADVTSVPSAAAASAGLPAVSSESSPASGPETVTLYSTQIATITSCAPTVTNCPASSTVLSTSLIPTGTSINNKPGVAATPASGLSPSGLAGLGGSIPSGLTAGGALSGAATASCTDLICLTANVGGAKATGSPAVASGAAGALPSGLAGVGSAGALPSGLAGVGAGMSAGVTPSASLADAAAASASASCTDLICLTANVGAKATGSPAAVSGSAGTLPSGLAGVGSAGVLPSDYAGVGTAAAAGVTPAASLVDAAAVSGAASASASCTDLICLTANIGGATATGSSDAAATGSSSGSGSGSGSGLLGLGDDAAASSGSVSADVSANVGDVHLNLNASVNVWETITILRETITTYTSEINSTCQAVSGTATTAQINLVEKDITILITLIKEAGAHLQTVTDLAGHDVNELAVIISELLIEIEFTISYAVKVIGFWSLRVVINSLSSIIFTLVSVVCHVVDGLAALLHNLLAGIVQDTSVILGKVVKSVLTL